MKSKMKNNLIFEPVLKVTKKSIPDMTMFSFHPLDAHSEDLPVVLGQVGNQKWLDILIQR